MFDFIQSFRPDVLIANNFTQKKHGKTGVQYVDYEAIASLVLQRI